jgi:flavodoxin
MKTAFVIYSATGNTKRVALQLKEMMEKAGKEVDWFDIVPMGDPKSDPDIQFEKIHDLSEYDTVLFGSYVEAFSLNGKMSEYLKQMKGCNGKNAIMLTTQHFPKKWMGGNQALKKMKKLLEEKGFCVLAGEDVNWKSKEEGRQERIDIAVDALAKSLEFS